MAPKEKGLLAVPDPAFEPKPVFEPKVPKPPVPDDPVPEPPGFDVPGAAALFRPKSEPLFCDRGAPNEKPDPVPPAPEVPEVPELPDPDPKIPPSALLVPAGCAVEPPTFVACELLFPNNPDDGVVEALVDPNAFPPPVLPDPNPPWFDPKPEPPKRPPEVFVVVLLLVFELFVLLD